MKRKGISPILASVLLLAVTLSVVGVFSGWAPEIARTVTDSTTNSTEQRIQCDKASVSLESVNYNSSNNDVELTVRNTGNLDLDNLILAAFDNQDTVMQQTTVSVSSGTLSSNTIGSVSSEPAYVRAYSQKCSDVTDRIDL